MATTQSKMKNLYLGAAELKRITDWPDIVIELLLSLAENSIIASQDIDTNSVVADVSPVKSEQFPAVESILPYMYPLAEINDLSLPYPQDIIFLSKDPVEIRRQSELFLPPSPPTLGTMAIQHKDMVEITGGSIAGSHLSSDQSAGINASITTADLVGKTITVKDGLITGYA